MHVKSAVILCVVYFITSVRSTGLNKDQIKIYTEITHESFNTVPDIMKKYFGYKNPKNIFENLEDMDDYLKWNELLFTLAYEGTIDNFEVPTLMAFEVEFYLNQFNAFVKRRKSFGILGRRELSELFKTLNIKEMEKAIKLIPKKDPKGGQLANAAEFLMIMIEILPEGNGLNQNQIQKFIDLYTPDKTTTGSIHPFIVQKIINSFDMTKQPQKISYRSGRPAAVELMELMIITAERSKTDHEKIESVLSTPEVRRLIAKFKTLDKNEDGILSKDEAKKFVEEFLVSSDNHFDGPFTDLSSIMRLIDKELNIAEFLFLHLLYQKKC